ncbi:hypothetical protein [Acidobacterium sp. S8]|uniref:hypothetical protein n=1 Tax=Acidobacterium sp. S8 TaxID=1641854 RepID=UPI00131C3277|nr:hypothetical protein [Acidobacterium sp. S8]
MTRRSRVSVPIRMLLACSAACVLTLPAFSGEKKPSQPQPKADFSIPVGPLGYAAPSSFYLTSRLSCISLDFIDKDHLLFTFRVAGLMKRMPDEPPNDEDQTIRAVVLELPEGKVTAKTEWRMHDRWRYLWRLADGKFLVRQRNALFVTDKSLELQPFIHTDEPLENVQISPDRKLIVMETERKGENPQTVASLAGPPADPPPSDKPVQIYILQTDTRRVVARAETLNPVEIPMMADGHLMSIPANQNRWLVRFAPFKGEERTLTEVESNCHPTEETVSKDVALVMTCPRSGNDHVVHAVNLEGKTLWQQQWESRYIWPTFQLAQDGSRFAFSSLEVSHSIGTMDPVDETSIRSQTVGVFDIGTGHLKLVRNATPVLSAGQNYALSPDGSQFAILREGAIEIYKLPPAPVVEGQ